MASSCDSLPRQHCSCSVRSRQVVAFDTTAFTARNVMPCLDNRNVANSHPSTKREPPMLVRNQEIELLKTRLPKVISPAAHGVIDYAHAAFFFTVGLLSRRSNKGAARAAFAASGFILAQSLLTDYRFGWKPLISFETHGKMDSVFASSSWLIPVLFGFHGT
ncbi:MAG TPA: hypothetical protein VF018_11605, partial [Acidobacteriaceae bacterium]